MENKFNINMEEKLTLPSHIQTPDQIYGWVHKYAEKFRVALLHNIMAAKGYEQTQPEGPWEKVATEIDVEADMSAKAEAFQKNASERKAKKGISKKFGNL